MATTRKAAPTRRRTTAAKKTPPAPQPEVNSVELTEDQKQAKAEAYYVLKQAGLAIPQSLQEVEEWIKETQARHAEEEQQVAELQQRDDEALAEANKNGPWYVRNAYQAPFNLRLDRQTEKRRIQLNARGMPGDLHPLKDEDLNDPVLKQNLHIGLIELIPAGEASRIIEKQTNNMTQRVHTPLSVLRNERDEYYKQGAVRVEAEYNSQGVTVAVPDNSQTDQELARGGGLQRVPAGMNPAHAKLRGQVEDQATSVVRSSFVPTGGHPASIRMGDDARSRAVDQLARRKNLSGPAAGLGDIQVVVEPTQRT